MLRVGACDPLQLNGGDKFGLVMPYINGRDITEQG